MKDSIKLLHQGNYSCVVKNGEETRTFSNHGVQDLYCLLLNDPGFLEGASIADKVVGKAAAMVMILGKAKELYTDLISTPALKILQENGIKVSFRAEAPVILNRTQNDWCPLEKLCYHENSLKNILDIVARFVEAIK